MLQRILEWATRPLFLPQALAADAWYSHDMQAQQIAAAPSSWSLADTAAAATIGTVVGSQQQQPIDAAAVLAAMPPLLAPPAEWTLLHIAAVLLAAGVLAFVLASRAIPGAMQVMFERGIFGIDINKTTPEMRKSFGDAKRGNLADFPATLRKFVVPESLGITIGGVYLCVTLPLLLFAMRPGLLHGHADVDGDDGAPHSGSSAGGFLLSGVGGAAQEGEAFHLFALGKCNAALSSIAFMLLLGFVDDVLDVRWRHKMLLSLLATLPLLAAYDGSTSVAVPIPLRAAFTTFVRDTLGPLLDATFGKGALLGQPTSTFANALLAFNGFNKTTVAAAAQTGDPALVAIVPLGPLYLVYLALFCVFCTNSINILAGVNGVEVGQTLIIAAAQMAHNVVQVVRQRSAVTALLQSASEKALAAAAAGGAVGPLEARTARTVHLLMSEQRAHILSLTLLAPLLGAGYALWRYNRFPSRVFVGDSFTYFAGMTLAVAGISGTYSKTLLLFFFPQLLNFVLSLPQLFGIIECPRHRVPRWNPKTNLLENSRNLTVLNAILAVTGPLHERTLTRVVIGFQVACCAAAFLVRYSMAGVVYDAVR